MGRRRTAIISTVKGEKDIQTRMARGAADSCTRCLVVQEQASMRLAATARAAWRRGGHDVVGCRQTLLDVNSWSSSSSRADLGAMVEISTHEHAEVAVVK